MYLYLKETAESTPVRIHAEADHLVSTLHNKRGWIVASFAEWWEGLGEDGQKHQRDLLAEGSEEALDATEQNFLKELEEATPAEGNVDPENVGTTPDAE